MIKIIFTFFFFVVLFFIYGCSGLIAGGGATTMIVAEGERTLGSVVDDATIKINLSAKFLKSENNLFVDINSTVLEGRVLLTGIVDTQEIRIYAVRRVWEIEGVKEVINEIEVGDKETIKEYANDLWIKTQIRALTAKNLGLKSFAYNFEVIRGKVYIAGITKNADEVELLTETVKNVKGVKDIVNYVILKK